jgi:transposase
MIDTPSRHQVTIDTVRWWRGRWADEGMAGLAGRRRSGRPPRITPVQVAEVKALACQLPAETGVALSRWSGPELARDIIARGVTTTISASTVRRILAGDTLKPWQHQSWIFIRDPDLAAKASRVLDLYARIYNGIPLDPDEYVISSDTMLVRRVPTSPGAQDAVDGALRKVQVSLGLRVSSSPVALRFAPGATGSAAGWDQALRRGIRRCAEGSGR